jgi:hypothetical protein
MYAHGIDACRVHYTPIDTRYEMHTHKIDTSEMVYANGMHAHEMHAHKDVYPEIHAARC